MTSGTKKCGHMDGKQVISRKEMSVKIRAAADARSSSDFLLIARTNRRAVEGLDAAIEPARLYTDAEATSCSSRAVLIVQRLRNQIIRVELSEGDVLPYDSKPRLDFG